MQYLASMVRALVSMRQDSMRSLLSEGIARLTSRGELIIEGCLGLEGGEVDYPDYHDARIHSADSVISQSLSRVEFAKWGSLTF